MRIDILHEAPAQMIFPERLLLYSLIYGLRPTAVLEIGSAEGGSAMIICAAMDAYGSGRLVCVDPAPRFSSELWSRIAHRAVVLQGFSTDSAILTQASKEAGSLFDLIFIDGDHSYLGTLRDVEVASSLLRSEGYLLFHDAHCAEVHSAIEEALKRFSFLDCGLLSVEANPILEASSGRQVVWGGLRLLRHGQKQLHDQDNFLDQPLLPQNPSQHNWLRRAWFGLWHSSRESRREQPVVSQEAQKPVGGEEFRQERRTTTILHEGVTLAKVAEDIGVDWKRSNYYDDAEAWIDDAWTYMLWPFIRECDFSCVVDLAAGHGRNTRKLLDVAAKLYVVDINEENIEFCQRRFAGEKTITYIKNDGFTLKEIPDVTVSLVYSFDAMIHFDSDVVRSYLKESYRILKPGGYGFFHYANYDKDPGGHYQNNIGWKNFMTEKLFHHYCVKEGFEVVKSTVYDNGTTLQEDCLTLFRKPL